MPETINKYTIIDNDNNDSESKDNKPKDSKSKDSESKDNRINPDDNILTVINKIINYCYDKTNKKKIEYSSLYVYYKDSEDDKIYPLSFIYESNKEIDYKLTDKPDEKFTKGGNRVNIPIINKLSKILYDIPIKDKKIYFNSLPVFLEKYKSFNDIFYYSVIKKFWPFINFNPKTYDAYIKNISLAKNLNRIKNVSEILDINNEQINIVNNSEKKSEFDPIESYKNIKLYTSSIFKKNINIQKLFADIKLNDDDSFVIFSKLVLNNYKDSFYKIYKPFIKENILTEKTCDHWIQGNVEFIYGKMIREQIENVLILKLYIKNKFYISLNIWKEGSVEIIIDNVDKILDDDDINETIKVCNKLLESYKNKKIYGEISTFDNTKKTKNINDWYQYIKNINYKLLYSKYGNKEAKTKDIIDTREGTRGNTNININKLKTILNNFSAYCRVVDDVDNPNDVIIRYKRVNNYVKIDNIDNQIIILYNQIQKGVYNPNIKDVKDKIVKKIQQDFELNKDDAKEKVNTTFMEIERNENFRVDKQGNKIYNESDIDPGAEVIFREDDNKIIIDINNIKSIYEKNKVKEFIEFIINFYTLYITDELPNEYKDWFNKVEPWVKKTDKYEDNSQKEIKVVVTKEDIPKVDSDDSDSGSSIESIGGGGKIVQLGGEGFILKRLKNRDGKGEDSLFKWVKKDYPDIETWVKKCQPVDRHPIVVDDKELEHINNSENLGSGRNSYSNVEAIGSKQDNKLNYICPKYWDVGKNISLDPNKMVPKTTDGERPQINDGEWYEGDIVPAKDAKSSLKSGIIQRESLFWNDAESAEDFYVEDTTKKKPPWQNPFGNPMPCCFNMKRINKEKMNVKEKKVNDKVNDEDDDDDTLLEFLGQKPEASFVQEKIKKGNIQLLANDILKNIKKLDIKKLDNEELISPIIPLIDDIKEIQSFKEIQKAIDKYNDIIDDINKLLNKIKGQRNLEIKLQKDIRLLIKDIEKEIKRLEQGENEINLYDKFNSVKPKEFIKPGIISGFQKARLENNSIMDCFLRISKYMQNKDDIKYSLELLDIEGLIKEAEQLDAYISEDIKNIEDIDEKKKKIIDILVDQIGEIEPVETVKSKTKGDITNIQNLNSLYDSEIVYDDNELKEEVKKISEYYELNKNLLVNLKGPNEPQIDFKNIIDRKKNKEGILPNLKSLDKDKKNIKSELEEYFLGQILTNYFESKNINKDVFNNDLVTFKELLKEPKIWQRVPNNSDEQKAYKKYWGSKYSKILYLLKKYSLELLKSLDIDELIKEAEQLDAYISEDIKNIEDIDEKKKKIKGILVDQYLLKKYSLDSLELLDIDELIKEAEQYDISEDIKNIEDIDEKKKKIIDILVDQIDETEPIKKYSECYKLFKRLFHQNRIINSKISTLIDSYIYKKYMNGYKKYLIKNIHENPLDFLRASDGNIVNSFYYSDNSKGDTLYDKINKAIEKYSKYINNESKHNDLFIIPVIKSILPEFVDTNIVVFERDKNNYQIKIPFDYFNDVDKNKKFVFIVKNGNIYEPLFYRYIEDNTNNKFKLTVNGIIKDSTRVSQKFILNMDTKNLFLKSALTNVIKELKDIYKMNKSIPGNILAYDKLIKILEKRKITIDKYFINIDNKVSHIITTEEIVIPIYPCGLMKKKPKGEIIGKDNIIDDYKKLPSPEITEYKKILSFYDDLNKTDNKFNYKSNDKINVIIDDNGDAVNLLFTNNTYIPINIKEKEQEEFNICGQYNLFELDFNLANNIEEKKTDNSDDNYLKTTNSFEYEHKIYYVFQDILLVYLLKNKQSEKILKDLLKQNIENINDNNKIQLINEEFYSIFDKILDELFEFTDSVNIDDDSDDDIVDKIKSDEILKIKKTCFNSSNMKDKFIYKFIQSMIKYDYPELITNISSYINIPISELKNTIKQDEIYYDYSIYLEDNLNLIFNEDNKYYKYLNLYGDDLPETY